jgi:hypothetical protein
VYSGTPLTTQVPVISSTPMFPFGRGDMGRSPFFRNFDVSISHDFTPLSSHENVKMRIEFTVFNLFNNSTIMDRFKTILHSSDGQLTFLDANGDPDYAAVFKGFDAKSLMAAQGDRVDPQ